MRTRLQQRAKDFFMVIDDVSLVLPPPARAPYLRVSRASVSAQYISILASAAWSFACKMQRVVKYDICSECDIIHDINASFR